MKIILPSKGKTGIKSVGMRMPKIKDIRSASELSEASGIRKNEFLELLLDDPKVLEKITLYDRDYLFLIAVAVISLNVISYTYTCKCGDKVRDRVNIGDLTPVFLSDKESLKDKVLIGKVNYTLSVITAKQEESAYIYAMEDEDKFEERFQDAIASLTIGRSLSKEDIEKTQNEDLMLYQVIEFFYKAKFHGTCIEKVSKCNSCGNVEKVVTDIKGNLLTSDTSILMDRYVSVSEKIDYMSYLSMTIPEYNRMIQSLENE